MTNLKDRAISGVRTCAIALWESYNLDHMT